MTRLVRRLHLVARRMLFVVLIIPVGLLHIGAWLMVIMCELGWVILGYVSCRTEHEWLQWTERLLDWMQELGDRMTALNSPPNVTEHPTAGAAGGQQDQAPNQK